MPPRPMSASATLFLILVSAMVWLALGILTAAGAHPAVPDSLSIRAALASGSVVAGGTLIGLVVLLAKRFRCAYYLGLAALSMSSLAIFFDQVGWTDLIVLVINLVPLFLLVKDRARYVRTDAAFDPRS